MKKIFVVVLPLALCSCWGWYLQIQELAPGEYWFVDARYQELHDNITLTVEATSMTVRDDLSVEVFMTWSTDWSTGALDSIDKPSDVHRATLFIRDGNDDEYEVVDGTGAAFGTLLYRDDAAYGSLVFDPLPEGSTYLRLIDLDAWKEITLIPAAVF